MNNSIYIVIPCYNEQEVLPETAKRMKSKLESLISSGKISAKSRIVFVNDGSKDRTWEIISELHKNDKIFSGINLSRNRGHQNALLAGLMTVKDLCDCDAAISIDADLQDDINAMDEMIDKFLAGCDIVYGVRSKRDTDTFFKRFTAEGFYHVLKFMGAEIVFNHADYRLMSKRALNGLADFKEVNLFLRGLVPMIGYSTDKVYYERSERFAGESKYSVKKMLALAAEGITSLSVKPLKFITFAGAACLAAALCILIYGIARTLSGEALSMTFAVLLSMWFIGGLTLVSLGIVGEYIGKIYMEQKNRPRFLVESFLHEHEHEHERKRECECEHEEEL